MGQGQGSLRLGGRHTWLTKMVPSATASSVMHEPPSHGEPVFS
jgi:hypothetical protein